MNSSDRDTATSTALAPANAFIRVASARRGTSAERILTVPSLPRAMAPRARSQAMSRPSGPSSRLTPPSGPPSLSVQQKAVASTRARSTGMSTSENTCDEVSGRRGKSFAGSDPISKRDLPPRISTFARSTRTLTSSLGSDATMPRSARASTASARSPLSAHGTAVT
jgi:hypothetical protein